MLRSGVKTLVDRIWERDDLAASAPAAPFETSAQSDLFYDKLLALTPRNEAERQMQTKAIQLGGELAQTRIFFAQSGNVIPTPFLIVLVCWVAIIFVSFGLFAQPNLTIVAALFFSALSASSAIFLILDLSHPFSRLITIPSAPLSNALVPLAP